jgi:hypothetical protein
MTPPAGRLSPSPRRTAERPEISLLEQLAAAGEALTDAIVHHDLDAIVVATARAEELVGMLDTHERARRDPANGDPGRDDRDGAVDRDVLLLGARIGATARRNALLLERAWATDAALLRLLAVAARDDAVTHSGAGYAPLRADAVPAGWLDRSA